jgi:hypothetical protein
VGVLYVAHGGAAAQVPQVDAAVHAHADDRHLVSE